MRNTDHRRAGYLAAVRAGLTHTAAAQAAGVDRSTARRWRADPLFRLQLRAAQDAHDADYMAGIAQRIAAAQQPEPAFVYTAPPSAWTPEKRAAARAARWRTGHRNGAHRHASRHGRRPSGATGVGCSAMPHDAPQTRVRSR